MPVLAPYTAYIFFRTYDGKIALKSSTAGAGDFL